MEIKNVHLFFEQSGTFKNEFKKLGFCAYDYDIQNNFGETDYIIDLFKEIEKAYDGKNSIFDNINSNDLIFAFFPCIYFCDANQLCFSYSYYNYKDLTIEEKTKKILIRSKERNHYYDIAIKLFCIVKKRGLAMIMENPYSPNGFLENNFVEKPTIIDKNRRLRGDSYIKPTAYWFVNCKP